LQAPPQPPQPKRELELARMHEVKPADPIDAALAKYPHVIDSDNGHMSAFISMTERLARYIGDYPLALRYTNSAVDTALPEIGRRRGADSKHDAIYREWIAPAVSGKLNLLIVHNGEPGVASEIRAADPKLKLG